MDKTLMRPLFRDKATQLNQPRKIDGSKVPKYAIGAAIQLGRAGLAGLGRVAQPAYQYLKTKAATPTGQKVLTGLEGAGVYMGAGDVVEGISEGDYYKTLGGLSVALPGMAYLPQTMRGTGIKALQGVKDFERLSPLKTGKGQLTALGGTGIGYGFAGDTEAEAQTQPTEEKEQIPVQDRLIYSKPEYSDQVVDETALEQSVQTKAPRPIGLKDPANKMEEVFNKDLPIANKIIDVAEQLGIDIKNIRNLDDKKLKQIAVESNVDIQDVYRLAGKSPSEATPSPAPKNPIQANNDVTASIPGMTDVEVQNLIKARKNQLAGAKQLSVGDQFKQFKAQINEVTGESNDNLLNLVAMKAAGKLLSGQTKQSGVRGFLEVGGQALEGAANDMMQLAISQKAQDMELAKAFLKMKTDQSQGPGFESGDKVFKIEDPNFPGNFYNVKGLTGKDGRIYYRDLNNNIVPAQQGQVGYESRELPEKINLYSANLEENKRAQEMINSVIEVLPDSGTFTAAFGLAKEDAYGTVEKVFGKNNLGGGDFDSEIKRLIRNNDDGTEQGKKDATSLMKKYDEDMAKVEKRAREIAKDAGRGGIFSRPTDKELETFTKLALIEQRMKYLVANANKAEDRLTQKDIENAEKNTRIIQFVGSAKRVKENYRQLRGEFAQKARGTAMQYRAAGGTESSMKYFRDNIPGVESLYEEKLEKTREEQLVQDKQSRLGVLNTMPGIRGK
jgi:hypothetical protein